MWRAPLSREAPHIKLSLSALPRCLGHSALYSRTAGARQRGADAFGDDGRLTHFQILGQGFALPQRLAQPLSAETGNRTMPRLVALAPRSWLPVVARRVTRPLHGPNPRPFYRAALRSLAEAREERLRRPARLGQATSMIDVRHAFVSSEAAARVTLTNRYVCAASQEFQRVKPRRSLEERRHLIGFRNWRSASGRPMTAR